MKSGTSKGRSGTRWTLLLIALFLLALAAGLFFRLAPELRPRPMIAPAFQIAPALLLASLPEAARFDFPIGSESGALTYNAQRFTESRHLGDDLNGIGGENSDRGDPVYAVADGRVLLAEEAGEGWGNVIIVLHAIRENGERKYVQSLYGHCETILVEPKQIVRRGEQIATVGTANGKYWAHLHFEMREFTTPFVGPGYRDDTRGWIAARRRMMLVARPKVWWRPTSDDRITASPARVGPKGAAGRAPATFSRAGPGWQSEVTPRAPNRFRDTRSPGQPVKTFAPIVALFDGAEVCFGVIDANCGVSFPGRV